MSVRSRGSYLVSLLITFAMIAALECGLRLVGFSFQPYTHYDDVDWDAFVEGRNRADYVPDSELFWRLMPDRTVTTPFGADSRIDVEGFRGPEVQRAKVDGRKRIVTLGDSGTFGWEVPEAESYPRALETILNAGGNGPAVEVVNAGVPGYTSLQGVRWFETHVRHFAPDLVIVCFGGNDGDQLDRADKDRLILPTELSLKSALLHSRLYQLAYWLRQGKGALATRIDRSRWVPRVAVPDFRANVSRIVDLAGGPRKVLLVARRGGPAEGEYAAALRDLAANRSIAYVDSGITGHPTGAGYVQVAREIADTIRRGRLLE